MVPGRVVTLVIVEPGRVITRVSGGGVLVTVLTVPGSV